MKTKLRSAFLSMVFLTAIAGAQTKVWDFGNDQATWPLSTGIGNDEIIVDMLGLHPIATNTNFGAITANNASFEDGFTATQRFQMNGGGAAGETFMPTQRYLFVDVDGPCTVKVWLKTGSNGSTRTLFITDGTALVGSATTNSGTNLDLAILTANYTSATGGRLYVYGDNAINLYKMQVTGANVTTSATASVDTNLFSSAEVFSVGKEVFVSNVKSSTQVAVYNMMGSLVKSVKTDTDTSFDFLTTGIYIVNLTSTEGQKSVKVAVQ